jgi:hypothetical protein
MSNRHNVMIPRDARRPSEIRELDPAREAIQVLQDIHALNERVKAIYTKLQQQDLALERHRLELVRVRRELAVRGR